MKIKLGMIKNIEAYYDDRHFFSFRRGYSLGTVYDFNPDDYYRYRLFNVGYSPSEKDFYFNYNVHLPKRVRKYLESKEKSPELEQEMAELGIVPRNEVSKMISDYEDFNAKAEMEREKLLNLKRTLRAKKH